MHSALFLQKFGYVAAVVATIKLVTQSDYDLMVVIDRAFEVVCIVSFESLLPLTTTPHIPLVSLLSFCCCVCSITGSFLFVSV